MLKFTEPTLCLCSKSSCRGGPTLSKLVVLLLSSRLESSSKTLFRDSKRCTIGEGWVGLRSKLNLLTKEDVEDPDNGVDGVAPVNEGTVGAVVDGV